MMSALLFNLVMDWVIRRTAEDKPRGIRWTLFSNLEDFYFADDVALFSHTHQHMQEKTSRLNTFAKQVGLKIFQKKTELTNLNIPNPSPIQVDEINLPTTEHFTHLGSVVNHDGGADSDIISQLRKARSTLQRLNNVWKSAQYSTTSKLRLYQSCVLSTLLFSSECCRTTKK